MINLIKIQWQIQGEHGPYGGRWTFEAGMFQKFCMSKESEPLGGMSWACPPLDLPMRYTEKYRLKTERKNYR